MYPFFVLVVPRCMRSFYSTMDVLVVATIWEYRSRVQMSSKTWCTSEVDCQPTKQENTIRCTISLGILAIRSVSKKQTLLPQNSLEYFDTSRVISILKRFIPQGYGIAHELPLQKLAWLLHTHGIFLDSHLHLHHPPTQPALR